MRIYILASAFIFLAISCAQRTTTPSTQLISRDTQGLLTIQADGQGVSRMSAERDAKRRTLNKLLFDGLPHPEISTARLPMVDGSKLSSGQREKLDKMLSDEQIDRFFNSVTWVDPKPLWTAGMAKKLQRFSLNVNYDLFRRELENQGVIRKFGF